MQGKKKCRMLREIRMQIASENDIPLVTEECAYKGDCKGTCPKCESELRYLEGQLEKRRSLGLKVTVSAVALGLVTSAAGCAGLGVDKYVTEGMVENPVSYTEDDTLCAQPLEGEIAEPQTQPWETLEGDVAWFPEEEETLEPAQ